MQKESHALLTTPEHRHCLLVLCILLYFNSTSNIAKAIFNLLSGTYMQTELDSHKVTFTKRTLILQNRVPESQLLE